MEKNVSHALIETIVGRTLADIQENPERSVRKLVDMALLVSKGCFQQHFFGIAQHMLEDEKSPYYNMIRKTVSYAAVEKLLRFGVNLGYNSCTKGARTIRRLKEEEGLVVPWSLSLILPEMFGEERQTRFHHLIEEGEALGLYTWMVFAENHPLDAMPLIHDHPDSAFFLFCKADDLTRECLERLSEMNNVMCVLRFDDGVEDGSAKLRERGMPYSVYFNYGDEEQKQIIGGQWMEEAEALCPVFTCLLARKGCSCAMMERVAAFAQTALDEQRYQTLPVEFSRVVKKVGGIISGDAIQAGIDRNGRLWLTEAHPAKEDCTIYCTDLRTMLSNELWER